ncbi:MAG: hypothetical protein JJU15_05155 [Pararhodobacter sp.]|nr:hypothetical protein [Pararhodobacter sp.]
MTVAPVPDSTLNAYVDGELSSHEAAALAHRAAHDPGVAARIAQLHHIKAAVGALADDLDFADPPEFSRPSRALRWPRRALFAVAAVLVLALGVARVLVPQTGPDTAVETARSPLVEGHDSWSAAFERSHDVPVAPEWLEGLMTATGLTLVHAAPSVAGTDRVMHYAFVGANDCRLSLFEHLMPGEVDMALSVEFEGALSTARWQMHGFGYTMVARDMDRARFTTIAAAVLDVTRIRAPVGEAIVASLRAARQRCTV